MELLAMTLTGFPATVLSNAIATGPQFLQVAWVPTFAAMVSSAFRL